MSIAVTLTEVKLNMSIAVTLTEVKLIWRMYVGFF